jgi:hypothetical protein
MRAREVDHGPAGRVGGPRRAGTGRPSSGAVSAAQRVRHRLRLPGLRRHHPGVSPAPSGTAGFPKPRQPGRVSRAACLPRVPPWSA